MMPVFCFNLMLGSVLRMLIFLLLVLLHILITLFPCMHKIIVVQLFNALSSLFRTSEMIMADSLSSLFLLTILFSITFDISQHPIAACTLSFHNWKSSYRETLNVINDASYFLSPLLVMTLFMISILLLGQKYALPYPNSDATIEYVSDLTKSIVYPRAVGYPDSYSCILSS